MRGARSPASSTRKCDAIWSPEGNAIRAQGAYPFPPLARPKGWKDNIWRPTWTLTHQTFL